MPAKELERREQIDAGVVRGGRDRLHLRARGQPRARGLFRRGLRW